MTETEVESVEISTECEDVDSLKEALLELCSGIPDELPDHPGLDERYGRFIMEPMVCPTSGVRSSIQSESSKII